MQNHGKFNSITLTGKILEMSEWTETQVSGGGGGGNAYVTVVNEVKSKTIRHRKVWVELDDGQQTEVTFRDSKFSVRVGHRVTFYGLRASRKGDDDNFRIVLCHNHTTGLSCRDGEELHGVTNDTVLGKFTAMLCLLVLAADIIVQWGARETHYIFGAVLFGIPALIVYGVVFTIRNAQAMRLISAEEKRLSGLPRHAADDDTVTVNGVRRSMA